MGTTKWNTNNCTLIAYAAFVYTAPMKITYNADELMLVSLCAAAATAALEMNERRKRLLEI